jgi:two-component system, OmpR family, KDP operon response regulator KdpE
VGRFETIWRWALVARGPRILVIDDDPAIRRLLRGALTTAGYRVEEVAPAQGAVVRIAKRPFDLLLLDIDEPAGIGPNPIAVLRDLSPAPILALSVRDDEASAASALENGADDYIRKPFGLNELLARVKIALRRRARERGKPALFSTGDIEIDLLHRRVRLRGQEIHLPVKRYEVLRVLAEGAGKVLTHEAVLAAVWGPRHADRVEYLRVAIRDIRRKLEADPIHPRYIVTEPRVGYRLQMEPRPDPMDRLAKVGRAGAASGT